MNSSREMEACLFFGLRFDSNILIKCRKCDRRASWCIFFKQYLHCFFFSANNPLSRLILQCWARWVLNAFSRLAKYPQSIHENFFKIFGSLSSIFIVAFSSHSGGRISISIIEFSLKIDSIFESPWISSISPSMLDHLSICSFNSCLYKNQTEFMITKLTDLKRRIRHIYAKFMAYFSFVHKPYLAFFLETTIRVFILTYDFHSFEANASARLFDFAFVVFQFEDFSIHCLS